MNLNPFSKEKELEKEFHVSAFIIFYKFSLGFFEFVSGAVISLFGSKIYHYYQSNLIGELTEDPHDLLARLSVNIVPHVLTHNTYIVIYLLILGFAKMLGAFGLIYKQNWGVDLLVGLTLIMAPFQIVNLVLHFNFFDLVYFSTGLLIALYLIEFRPKAWVSRMLKVIQ